MPRSLRSSPITSPRRFPAPLVAALLLLTLGGGCAEDISIRTYEVAKSESRRAEPLAGSPTATAREQQMLAAIVPNKNSAWFFKLTGDPEVVDKNREQFKSIINSVEFEASGDPRWELLEGWSEQRSQGITYANLTQSEDGLTATVTQLPVADQANESDWHAYIVSNINRWRNQLSLDQQNWEQMQAELEEVPELSQGPTKAYFVSLIGQGSGSMSSGAPFLDQMRRQSTPAASTPSAEATPAAATPPASSPVAAATPNPLEYDAPDSWKELEASGMRRAAFAIEEGEQKAEVTVIAAGGSIEANIGIWLGQVGTEASEENKSNVLKAAEPVTVNETQAQLYSIPGGSEAAGSILIADIPWRAGESLFVKLKGDASLVASQREPFIDFLKSIRW